MDLAIWAAWGLGGAFVYAAPRLVVAFSEKASISARVAEFIVALSFGPIFSAGFGPFAAGWVGLVDAPKLQALALVIGMVANPVAPAVVKLATGDILRRLGGTPNGDGK